MHRGWHASVIVVCSDDLHTQETEAKNIASLQ